jgi:hypothetical protein
MAAAQSDKKKDKDTHAYPDNFVSQIPGAIPRPRNQHDVPLHIDRPLCTQFATPMHAMEAVQWTLMRCYSNEYHLLSVTHAEHEIDQLYHAIENLDPSMKQCIDHRHWVPHLKKSGYSHTSQNETPFAQWVRITEYRKIDLEHLRRLFACIYPYIDISYTVRCNFSYLTYAKTVHALTIVINECKDRLCFAYPTCAQGIKMRTAAEKKEERDTEKTIDPEAIDVTEFGACDNKTLLAQLAYHFNSIAWALVMNPTLPFATQLIAEEHRYIRHGAWSKWEFHRRQGKVVLRNPLREAICGGNTVAGAWLVQQLPAERLCDIQVNMYSERFTVLISALCRWRPCAYTNESAQDGIVTTLDGAMVTSHNKETLDAMMERMQDLRLFYRVEKDVDHWNYNNYPKLRASHTHSFGWNASDYLKLHPRGKECAGVFPDIAKTIHYYTDLPGVLKRAIPFWQYELLRLLIHYVNGCMPTTQEWSQLEVPTAKFRAKYESEMKNKNDKDDDYGGGWYGRRR